MKAGAIIIGLLVVVGVLEIIKRSKYADYAWIYVAIILLGIAVYNQPALVSFGSYLQTKLGAR